MSIATDDTVTSQTVTRPNRGRFGLSHIRDMGIVIVAIALFIALSLSSDVFLSLANLSTVLEQWAPVAIVAVAGTFVLISGQLDISTGGIFAVSGVVAAMATNATQSVLVGVLAGCGTGAICGVLNAGVVTFGRVNSLIATLGTSLVIRGLAVVITGGFIVQVQVDGFRTLGVSQFLGLRWSVWLMIATVLVLGVVLHATVFGRQVFAVGGNAEAARLSGVNVDRIKRMVFVVSGLAAGLAGVIAASKVGSGQAAVGGGFEFQVLAAVVLGGTSLSGGAGAVWRTVLGVMLLAMIGNGLNLLGVDPVYQQIVQGAIIITAVAVDAWSRRGRRMT